MTEADAVYNWDLPLEAIQEIVEYCQTHQELLRQEARQGRELTLQVRKFFSSRNCQVTIGAWVFNANCQ